MDEADGPLTEAIRTLKHELHILLANLQTAEVEADAANRKVQHLMAKRDSIKAAIARLQDG